MQKPKDHPAKKLGRVIMSTTSATEVAAHSKDPATFKPNRALTITKKVANGESLFDL